MQKTGLVVRNTFIEEEADSDLPPPRTQSDPTGRHGSTVIPLRPGTIPAALPEGTQAEERGDQEDEEDDDSPLVRSSRNQAPTGGVVDAVEDDDEGGLLRTKSRFNGNYGSTPEGTPTADSGKLVSGAAASSNGPRTMNLSRLVPEVDPGALNVTEETMQAAFAAGLPATGMPLHWMTQMPWGGYPMPYGMYPPPYPVYPQSFPEAHPAPPARDADASDDDDEVDAEAEAKDEEQAGATSSSATASCTGPPLGASHSFHQETKDMGIVPQDFRQFTKVGYEGRLSVVSESQVHFGGRHKYLVQFTAGELSRADGVGFVFSPRLPCAKNIQRIVSIFVNQRGRICLRVFAEIVRASTYIKTIEQGDWVELDIDLDAGVAVFRVWPQTATGWPATIGSPSSVAEFRFGSKLGKLNQAQQKQVKLSVGHLAVVVKNVGVTVTLAS